MTHLDLLNCKWNHMLPIQYQNTKNATPVDASGVEAGRLSAPTIESYDHSLNINAEIIGKLKVAALEDIKADIVVQSCSYGGPSHYKKMYKKVLHKKRPLLVWAHVDIALLEVLQDSYKPYGLDVKLDEIVSVLKTLQSKVIVHNTSPSSVAITVVDGNPKFSDAHGAEIGYMKDGDRLTNSIFKFVPTTDFQGTIIRSGVNAPLTRIGERFHVQFDSVFDSRGFNTDGFIEEMKSDREHDCLSTVQRGTGKIDVVLKPGELVDYDKTTRRIGAWDIGTKSFVSTLERLELRFTGSFQTAEDFTLNGMTLIFENGEKLFTERFIFTPQEVPDRKSRSQTKPDELDLKGPKSLELLHEQLVRYKGQVYKTRFSLGLEVTKEFKIECKPKSNTATETWSTKLKEFMNLQVEVPNPDRSALNLNALISKSKMTFGITCIIAEHTPKDMNPKKFLTFATYEYTPPLRPIDNDEVSYQNLADVDTRVFSPHFTENKTFWGKKFKNPDLYKDAKILYSANDKVDGDVILLQYSDKITPSKELHREAENEPLPTSDCSTTNTDLTYKIYNHDDIRLNVDAIVKKIETIRRERPTDVVAPRTSVYPTACDFTEAERLNECVYGVHQLYDNYDEGTGLYTMRPDQTLNECAIVIGTHTVSIRPIGVYMPVGEPHRFTCVRLNNVTFNVPKKEFDRMRKSYKSIHPEGEKPKQFNLIPFPLSSKFYKFESVTKPTVVHPLTTHLENPNLSTQYITENSILLRGKIESEVLKFKAYSKEIWVSSNITYICDHHIRALFQEQYPQCSAFFDPARIANPFAIIQVAAQHIANGQGENDKTNQMPYYECMLYDRDTTRPSFPWGKKYIMPQKYIMPPKPQTAKYEYQGNRICVQKNDDLNMLLTCSQYRFTQSHVYDRVTLDINIKNPQEVTITWNDDEVVSKKKKTDKVGAKKKKMDKVGATLMLKYRIKLEGEKSRFMILSVEEKTNGSVIFCDYNVDGSITHRVVCNNKKIAGDQETDGIPIQSLVLGYSGPQYWVHPTINVVSQLLKLNSELFKPWPAEHAADQLDKATETQERPDPALVYSIDTFKIYKLREKNVYTNLKEGENVYFSNLDPVHRQLKTFWDESFGDQTMYKPVYSDAYHGGQLCDAPDMNVYFDQLELQDNEEMDHNPIHHVSSQASEHEYPFFILDDLFLRLTYFEPSLTLFSAFEASSSRQTKKPLDAYTIAQLKTHLKLLNRWKTPKSTSTKDDALWIELSHGATPCAFGILVNLANRQIQRQRIREEDATNNWTMFELIAGSVDESVASSSSNTFRLTMHPGHQYDNEKFKCGNFQDMLKHIITTVCTARGKKCIRRCNDGEAGMWLPMKSSLTPPDDHRHTRCLPLTRQETTDNGTFNLFDEHKLCLVQYRRHDQMAEEVYTKTATDILKTIRKTVFIPMTDNNWSYTEQNQMLQVCNYATVIQHRVMAITEIKQENTVSEAETAELKEAFNMLYDL